MSVLDQIGRRRHETDAAERVKFSSLTWPHTYSPESAISQSGPRPINMGQTSESQGERIGL
jgi:hypothetical protein